MAFSLQLSYTFLEPEAIVGYHIENMFETRVPTWELPQLQRPQRTLWPDELFVNGLI